MITDALFGIFTAIVEALLGLLPDIDPPDLTGMVEALEPMWEYLGWMNKYIPIVEIGGMIVVLVTVQVAMFFVNMTIWVLTKAHILGGGSDV